MTLTQAARSVIAQWWIVVLTAALAAGVAVAVQSQREPEYASTTVLRLSAQMTTAAAEGVLQGVAVDVDPSIITAPPVLAPAAAAMGVEVGTVAGRVQVTSNAPNLSGRTSQAEVTTTADTPGGARDLASAVASSYQNYLVSQVDSARTALEARRASAQGDASQYQQALRVDPEPALATGRRRHPTSAARRARRPLTRT